MRSRLRVTSLFLFADTTAEHRIVRWRFLVLLQCIRACKTIACSARIVSGGAIETFGPNVAEAVEGRLRLFAVSKLQNKRLLEAICFQPSSSANSLHHALSI